jgi:hypothetical protein
VGEARTYDSGNIHFYDHRRHVNLSSMVDVTGTTSAVLEFVEKPPPRAGHRAEGEAIGQAGPLVDELIAALTRANRDLRRELQRLLGEP